jgi:hypothetical protein
MNLGRYVVDVVNVFTGVRTPYTIAAPTPAIAWDRVATLRPDGVIASVRTAA